MNLTVDLAAEVAQELRAALSASLTLRSGELLAVFAPIELATELSTATLDSSEKMQMLAYRFTKDRQRYHVAHVVKRLVIGQMLGLPPQRLAFTSTDRGKPQLSDRQLHFSISHSGNWIVIALRSDVEIGVDLEWQRNSTTDLPWSMLHHPDEPQMYDAASFFRFWTLKEAITKCSGEGLMFDFTRLLVQPQHPMGYRGTDGKRCWQAWHGLIDAATHLAVASPITWSIFRCLRLAIPPATSVPRDVSPLVVHQTVCEMWR
ncbi:4'-phosphopantetheinyl transferase family protein [Pollutimonas bauzanensis]|uniref:4'-phosphopantetheinyl transferase n=1 Tax=Pollutimonas bauzanensis TaxID=658167 RepID=A0A1M5MSF2_9BURK|nr:4'-phosphopantetheinyl transferase superfamily protein [Pollutimonas bauzanensis]SHG80156.1 4'-phosphopantetheinyl transferase [Pollutimonas bauzanensis]